MRNKKFGGLGKVLATGALAVAALAAPLKVKANPVIAYENSITEVNADGLGTFGDDVNDFYTVGLRVENVTFGGGSDDACWQLEMDADFADRGAYNFRDQFSAWSYDESASGQDSYFGIEPGTQLEPGFANWVYYDVKEDDVLGWETVGARMYANSGVSNEFGTTAPIPEPATISLLAGGALAALAGRRIKENYRKF